MKYLTMTTTSIPRHHAFSLCFTFLADKQYSAMQAAAESLPAALSQMAT